MKNSSEEGIPLIDKLNSETAKIEWKALQVYFAGGTTIHVESSLDLVEVGKAISANDAEQVKQWMDGKLIEHVSDDQALEWVEKDALVWALVVRPWVLVQSL
ncbi:DUF2288 domain-containing protein [Francisellaceae bacterium]|nr:DUF2288 domain-containing protein [Francisellaceae bacterium]